MAPPRIEKIITALDVGSWKVCALIAGQTADGKLHVLGTGQVLDILENYPLRFVDVYPCQQPQDMLHVAHDTCYILHGI